MLQCDVTFHLIILGFNSNSDSSLWLWVAQAGQPEAKCLSEFPHGHQHIPNWISSSLHQKVLSEAGHFKCDCLYFSLPSSLSFSCRWNFQECNTGWKRNFQAQHFGNPDSPPITAYLDNEISPAARSVSIWTAERGKHLLSRPCILGAQVCVVRQEGPTLPKSGAYAVFSTGTRAERRHPISVSLTWPKAWQPFQGYWEPPSWPCQGREPTHRSSRWSLLNRQEQNELLINESC